MKLKTLLAHAVTLVLACAISITATLWVVNNGKVKAKQEEQAKIDAAARPTDEQEIIEDMYGYYKCYDVLLDPFVFNNSEHIVNSSVGTELYIGKQDFFYKTQDIMNFRKKRPDYYLLKLDETFLDTISGVNFPMPRKTFLEADFAYALFLKEYDPNSLRYTPYFLQIDDEYFYLEGASIAMRLEKIA